MKVLLQGFMAIVISLLLSSYSMAAPASWQQIIAQGELRVGLSLATPWVMKGKDGSLIGSEPDIASRLAQDMGLKLKLVELPWEQLVPALKQGRIDIIVSGLSISPSLAMQVNFSHSYAESGIGLASHIAKTQNISTMADLQRAKLTMAAVAGSSGEVLSKRLFKNAKLKLFYSIKEAGLALAQGEVDILIGPSTELRFLSLRNPDVIDQPLATPLLNSYEAFAVRKGDHDFINFLNAWILSRKADAWIDSSRYYWFQTLRWQELVAP
ncbi:transporter substrate-binding domain-containing protein [Dasania sp. GY-MA-18]|uniref:Transporter substrate-binding domain-containing protein n=1 Tax=Dasania phycosphaerae TaxID=2950436 RepID=A0A9J6RQA1_9GAMM|nr:MULTISPECIES: transporter substrate-binding domain-containing protein [Dasania]MCR8923779.1 transporter substrate-binding domain-containing protein [Dasania sp. GY-MA-18]MCZ0866213.1 transporter substrate-binding domain-containing protein [Dasania phycosphaerae]MCZ0869937.1 transporter substrate-binding domain-containing protein [Dasania phycosphaerae]